MIITTTSWTATCSMFLFSRSYDIKKDTKCKVLLEIEWNLHILGCHIGYTYESEGPNSIQISNHSNEFFIYSYNNESEGPLSWEGWTICLQETYWNDQEKLLILTAIIFFKLLLHFNHKLPFSSSNGKSKKPSKPKKTL